MDVYKLKKEDEELFNDSVENASKVLGALMILLEIPNCINATFEMEDSKFTLQINREKIKENA